MKILVKFLYTCFYFLQKIEQKNKKSVKVVLNQKAVILNLTLLINSLTNPFQVISSSVFITFPWKPSPTILISYEKLQNNAILSKRSILINK